MVSTTELFAGRFRLGALLGQGGMSDVYRAVDEETGESVAVKIVRSGDPELARRVAQEVKVHQRMTHVGLIRLLDTGVADGQAYLVMELIEGATLAASLRAEPLGARLTAKLGGILGAALAYVHSEGIVHRDVKPSNIMLGADGRALLGDFGIARLLDATTFTIDGTTIGTMAYMAPEQLEDHSVGPPADIWSLGMVLLECLTGRRVYEGTSAEIIARRLAGPVPLPADLPVPWKLLLTGMLDHRPEERLDGTQVAALLSSPAYSVPWTPGPPVVELASTRPMDLTALAAEPGAAATAVAGVDAVTPTPTPPTQALVTDGTVVGGAPPPLTAPGASTAESRRDRHQGGRGRAWWIALLVLVLLAGAGGLAYALLSGKTPSVPPATTTTTTVAPTTTSTSTTTTTLPPAPTGPSALAALVQDVASGVVAGSVTPGVGPSLTHAAQQAVNDEAASQPDQAANDLQRAASIIANGEQDGSIQGSEGSTLQSDLSTLASALGLSAAGQAPTTTTTTTLLPDPGGKHHKGP